MGRVKLNIIIFFFFSISSIAQTIEDISFGTDNTFEIITWNIEHFPKKGQTTIDYVKRVITAIDADVYAIQEVSNISSFNQLVNSLPDYDGYLVSDKFRGLAYIYKKNSVQINSIYEIYNSSTYSVSFPRYPMVMDLTYKNQQIIIINNHLKCCGDGTLEINNQNDEEARRYNASILLKQYIDANFSNKNVILVGDLNDILTDNASNNVFQKFIDDSSNYKFADMNIASGNNTEWSYPSWPSHLDHILITNELFDEFNNNTTVIKTFKIENYVGGWNSYDTNITDHRPVALKFTLNSTLGTIDNATNSIQFKNYPNPFKKQTTFSFKRVEGKKNLLIYDILGRKILDKTISGNSYTWISENYQNGIYLAKLKVNGVLLGNLKLLLID